MKLLLTSAGFTNRSVINALRELVEKPFDKLKLAFIPTAANIEEGGKEWLIDDLYNCKSLKLSQIDIVDISALGKDIWLPRLEQADILFFGGGNTQYLMYWLEKSGLKDLLLKMLKTKIYVGLSAGSMVASRKLSFSQLRELYSEKAGEIKSGTGLGLVNFQVRPHFNSKWFPKVRIKYLNRLGRGTPEPIYALDDNSAVLVNGQKISVVSEGKWERFN